MSDTQGPVGTHAWNRNLWLKLPHLDIRIWVGGWVEANQSFFEKVQNGPKVMVKIKIKALKYYFQNLLGIISQPKVLGLPPNVLQWTPMVI